MESVNQALAKDALVEYSMRLYVNVKRYELPDSKFVYSVTSGQQSCSISALMFAINKQMPMESGNWGLEDYSLRLNGYDLLHYSKVDEVLRDGDQIE